MVEETVEVMEESHYQVVLLRTFNCSKFRPGSENCQGRSHRSHLMRAPSEKVKEPLDWPVPPDETSNLPDGTQIG